MRLRSPLLIAVVLPLLAAAPAAAQDGFLFGAPKGQLTIRGGPMMHSANSDLFDFFTSQLTLERKDFSAPSIGAELGIVVSPQLDLMIGLAHAETEKSSMFRDWYEDVVGDDTLFIHQETTFRTIPLTVSARYYPMSRGEAVSSLAWVPRKVTPYVGAGAGVTWFNLRQRGDFIEETPENVIIFWDDYTAANHAITMHALAGTDVWLSSKLGLNVEGRYTRGSAPLNQDFEGWNDIDLSGFQAGIGLTLRW